jgi:hypothetical protein
MLLRVVFTVTEAVFLVLMAALGDKNGTRLSDGIRGSVVSSSMKFGFVLGLFSFLQ